MPSSPRWALPAALVLVAVATVATVAVAVDPPARGEPAGTADPSASPTSSPHPGTANPADALDPGHQVLLVWGHGGVGEGFARAVEQLPGVVAVSAVKGDRVDLARSEDADGRTVTAPPGRFAIPLDAQVIDPSDHVDVLGKDAEALGALRPGTTILGETSAALRGVGVGGLLVLADGTELEVVAVVADDLVGWSELVLHPEEPLDVRIQRYLLVRHEADAAAVEAAIRGLTDDVLRVRPIAEAAYLRHGDAVLPQVVLKERFGEFTFHDVPGREIRVGASWRDANLERRRLPQVGAATCHKAIWPALEQAFAELDRRGLLHTLSASRFQGCWVGRVIGSSRTLSHHSWGIAIDFNVSPRNAFEAELDPGVIEVMEAHGFVWGGRFLRPDEPHFEYVGE